MAQKGPIVYVNGEFLGKGEAKVSVFDQGLLFGDGVFDTLVAANGYVFKLEHHVARLLRSARAVKIQIPNSEEEIKRLVVETIRRSGLADAYVKIIVTRGVAPKPIMGRGDIANPTVIIFAVPPLSVVSEDKIENGAKLVSTTIKRTHPDSIDPRVKSLNYQANMLMRIEAMDRGADEAICFGFDGYVAEGGGENIWIIKDKSMITPGHGVLEGVTRETVFEIAKELGYKTMIANISKYDLFQADEIFLCSTAGGIIPVTEVDHRPVGDGIPGPITKQVKTEYSKMLQQGVHGTSVLT